MAVRRLTRPERTPEAMTRFMRQLQDEFASLGIAVGEEFLISNGKDERTRRQLESHDENATGGSRATDPDTSRKAALQNMPRSGSQRHRALVAIVAAGEHGLTGHEVAETTGIEYRSVTPRLRELKDGGWIEDADFTRTTNLNAEAHVLIATDKGRRECGDTLSYREETLL